MSASRSKILPCGRNIQEPKTAPSGCHALALKQRLREYLQKNSLKFTEQRWSIAEAIISSASHLDPGQIVEQVRKKHPHIGVATIYRNIKVLCDAGILSITHHDATGQALYEVDDGSHHDHIICEDCGESIEFFDKGLEELKSKIARSQNFEMTGHQLVIYAHCPLKN